MRDWESTFVYWSQGPATTEQDRCENAIRAIRDAIASSEKLNNRGVTVFLQGSYRNRVNVRKDSDVDIGVVCTTTFFGEYPEGTTRDTFGNISSDYQYSQFKDEVEEALVAKFGRVGVARGNRSFDIHENTYRVESDVAAFFEHRRYSRDGNWSEGVELRSDNDGARVINFPEQHYRNGVSKNDNCSRRYKRLVRVLKKLSIEMEENGVAEAKGIPGFLCECLIWNVPNAFVTSSTYCSAVRSSLIYLYEKLGIEESSEWGEVSELNYLFHSRQKWSKATARDFVAAVWRYVGFE